MKKLIALLALIFAVAATASAFPYGSSSLHISVVDYGHYTVEVNGKTYVMRNGHVNLEGLRPGHYRLRLMQHQRVGRGYGAPTRQRIVFQGRVFIPQHTTLQAHYERGAMRYQEVMPLPPAQAYHAEPMRHRGPVAMHPNHFEGLMASMRRTPFDRTRLEIAKAALNSNYVTTAQVRVIMRQFSFDSNKLEIAKFAFASVVDPERYYSLTQEFTFDSNARALLAYIH